MSVLFVLCLLHRQRVFISDANLDIISTCTVENVSSYIIENKLFNQLMPDFLRTVVNQKLKLQVFDSSRVSVSVPLIFYLDNFLRNFY